MTGGRFAGELALAAEVADRAGALLIERLGRAGTVRHKSPKDIVTEVDNLSEELILAAIRAVHPDDSTLAEESGLAGPANGRTWVIDPLDGTINYANGIPFFCVSIGLVVDGVPSVGVVRDPIRAETYAATVDGPATLDGRPIRVSAKELVSDLVISLTIDGERLSERLGAIRQAIRVTRRLGSSALALAYVGNGRFDAFAQTHALSAWDVAAAGLIAERAGAMVTDVTGGPWFDLARPTQRFSIVAAPPAHHDRLLALVRPAG
ncbi:MAG: monophosphatase [Chloroflexota bacterium]|nr:monophosphatase [Chloroflexota bacterium]